ncbi:hypothetical protein F4804DRAFT_117921 [Jackrogersella minutella]|nr:hypothetical protein F4804DRAFT_117921 [Jackrogersella minutella]
MEFNRFTSSTLSSTSTVFRQHRTLVAAAAAAAVITGISISLLPRIADDYRAWYALGPNGIPLNPLGYIFQSMAKPFARRDVRSPAPYDESKLSKRYGPIILRSFLPRPLSPRSGERPEVPDFVGPHRQTTQEGGPAVREKQEAFLHALAAANPSLIQVKPSHLEGPKFNGAWVADGITLRDDVKRLGGEFAHPHGEGSTHLVLSLVDAAKAIETGWAERHRMSGVGKLIPWGFVMIYAPRNEAELQVWKEFMVASARYTLGSDTEVVMP